MLYCPQCKFTPALDYRLLKEELEAAYLRFINQFNIEAIRLRLQHCFQYTKEDMYPHGKKAKTPGIADYCNPYYLERLKQSRARWYYKLNSAKSWNSRFFSVEQVKY